MIKCDNCGFGHLTFEELRACKPWSAPADPAQSAPSAEAHALWLEFVKRKVSGFISTDDVAKFATDYAALRTAQLQERLDTACELGKQLARERFEMATRAETAESALRDAKKLKLHDVKIHVYQQDWGAGFASFYEDGELKETAKAHVTLNLGAFLSGIEIGDFKKEELPYWIAESIMHEVMHVLESWCDVEFSEEKVEALLTKYRSVYRPDLNEKAETALLTVAAQTPPQVKNAGAKKKCICGHDEPTHRVDIGGKNENILHKCYCCECEKFTEEK